MRDTTASDLPQLLDWRGACAALGGTRPISRATLDRITRSGALQVMRPSPGAVRWCADDIRAYLDRCRYPQNGKVA